MLISISKLNKTFINKRKKITVLNNLWFDIEKGEMLGIVGKSGCGKTTLLNILGGLDYPDSGEYKYNDNIVQFHHPSELSKFRKSNIGFIPQGYTLLNYKSVFYNIALPLKFRSYNKADINDKVNSISLSLGIQGHLKKTPKELSMGECQRVAIARAIITNPALILADEPTSALDSETEEIIIRQFEILQQNGSTIIAVTHNKFFAGKCNRILNLESIGTTIEAI